MVQTKVVVHPIWESEGLDEPKPEFPSPTSEWTRRVFSEAFKQRIRGRYYVPEPVIEPESLGKLIEGARATESLVAGMRERIERMEATINEMHELLISLSQAYYWSPEWRRKEARADREEKAGKSKAFESVDELIEELNA